MECKDTAAYLASNFSLQLNSLILINEPKLLQHSNTLPIVGQELQVLIGHELLQSGNVVRDEPFIVAHAKVPYEVRALDAMTCLSCVACSTSSVERFADRQFFKTGPV